MSKTSPANLQVRYSEQTIPDTTMPSVSSKLKLKNLIIKKIFILSLKKAKNSSKQLKDTNDEIIENLVFVEREYVKNLINSKGSKKRGGSGEVQRTPEKKPCKKFARKKSSVERPKHVKRGSSIRKYDSTCSSPLSEKFSRVLV